MNRPRKHDRRHWPDYLNARKKAGGLYYTWRHPSTGKEYGLGYVFAEAAAQAREANLKLLAPPTAKATLADRLTGGGNTMTAWLDRFKIILDQRPGKKKNSDTRADSTKVIDARRIETLRDHFAGTLIEKIGTKDCADLIQKYQDAGHGRAAADIRGFMVDCFSEAESAGWIARGSNPADITKAKKPRTKRSRLTLDNYQVILDSSSGWLKTAMLLALVTGQRVSDVAHMEYSSVKHGFLSVQQIKTGQRIKIPIGIELLGYSLADVIKQSRGIVGAKTIVHQSKKTGRSALGASIHEGTISRAFTALVSEKLTPDWNGTPPTFHEIRSLSKTLHRDNGIDTLELLGHDSEESGKIYADPRGGWVEVKLPRTA